MVKKSPETERLPGIDWVLDKDKPSSPKEDVGQRLSDEELLGDLPKPGEPTRDSTMATGRKIKVAASSRGKVKGKGTKGKRKRGKISSFFIDKLTYARSKFRLLIPQDPVERMRFKLRWLGIVKFPITFIIIAIISILLMFYLWFIYFNYEPDAMFYSKELPLVVVFVPAGIGAFCCIYFGVNLTLLNWLERRMTAKLESMLEGNVPFEEPKDKSAKEQGKSASKVKEMDA